MPYFADTKLSWEADDVIEYNSIVSSVWMEYNIIQNTSMFTDCVKNKIKEKRYFVSWDKLLLQ